MNVSIIVISIIINTLIFLYNEKIASLLRLYDKPSGNRKIHKLNVPLTGGLIVFLNITVVIIFLLADSSYLKKINIFDDKTLYIYI